MDSPMRVLHVDDEASFGELVVEFLQRENERFKVSTVTSADKGLHHLSDDSYEVDCIVSDFDMPGMNGIEFLKTVRDDRPELPFILFTGKGSEEVASDAISAGATDYLQKGSGTDQYTVLANRVQNAVNQYRSQRRAAEHERITEVIRNINRALVYADTVDEIEHDVCTILSDDSLPSGDPVFIDIETDGLEPSVAWLVGVLDGDATDGTYMPFRQPAPGSAEHLEAFLTWADANASGRPLVAWNGWKFDFPVLEAQIRQHCPAYEETWDDRYTFDPLWWATRKNGGNAVLPGHDNSLETVASALGWTPATTGLDGKTVAEIYTAYRQAWLAADDPSSVQPPAWDRLEAYCEDDVRALATIYDALDAAARRDRGTTNNGTPAADSTQGALSDFT